jgi:hypothetical protein
MTRSVIQWQDQFGRWKRFQEKHCPADAFRTAQARARSTGKRHLLVDSAGATAPFPWPRDAAGLFPFSHPMLVQLVSDADPHLQVQCWRRIPGGDSWNPRCGPMSLVTFIRRFLPGGTSD